MSKSLFLSMCILLVFACVLQAAVMRKGPYLFYPGDNTEMTVLWQLDDTAACTLEWGVDETYSVGSVESSEYGDDHQHKYTISGLAPGGKYYYRVILGAEEHVGTFVAALAADVTSLKFLAHGDTRSYSEDHDRVDAGMVAAFEADAGYQTMTLLSGDWVGSGTSEDDWDEEFFGDEVYSNSLYIQANLPFNGCIGNHEALGPTLYDKYWPYPYVDGYYWAFEYGPALFLVIDQYDTTLTTNSAQLKWIENQLSTTDKEWKFLQFHAPGYSAGGGHRDDKVVQKLIQPLCEQYGVDIVFAGHNHYYARCEVNGIQHITTGGGGAPLREPEPDYSEYVVTCRMAHHFCQVEIDGNVLNFEAWDVNEANSVPLIDSFTIVH